MLTSADHRKGERKNHNEPYSPPGKSFPPWVQWAKTEDNTHSLNTHTFSFLFVIIRPAPFFHFVKSHCLLPIILSWPKFPTGCPHIHPIPLFNYFLPISVWISSYSCTFLPTHWENLNMIPRSLGIIACTDFEAVQMCQAVFWWK